MTSAKPSTLAWRENSRPYTPSRSRSKYRGSLFQPQTSVSWRAVQTAVGMCDIHVENVSSIMAENDQDIKHAKCRGGNRKKIQRDQLARVVFQERFPALRRRLPVSNHVLGYCGLRYLNAKFEQFSMNPWRTPQRICSAHFTNEYPQLPFYTGSPAATTLPPPIVTESLPMPTNHGRELYNVQTISPI